MVLVTEWRISDATTGETTRVKLTRKGKRGRKPTVKGMHGRVATMVKHPAPRNSVRLMTGGGETSVLAARVTPVPFAQRVEEHQRLLRRRKSPQATEVHPPIGQAALWHTDVILCVPRTGRDVARQIARLCGDDSRVTIPIRSLADAVGHRDSAGRDSAYTRRGIKCLVDAEWLRAEVTGSGQDKVTTYYLLPGDESVEWFPVDDEEWKEARL